MKKTINLKIIRKFVILLFLVGGVAYLGYQNNNQPVEAAQCCSSCPGGGDPGYGLVLCEAQCGSAANSCYDACESQVYRCYGTCVQCGGGGGFNECQFDTQCLPGEFCINGLCS